MAGLRYIDQAVSLELDPAACTGCGRCVQVCPRAVLEMRERRAVIVDKGACIECGACERNCEFAALTVEAGVGCAQAIITGWIRGTEPSCGEGCCS